MGTSAIFSFIFNSNDKKYEINYYDHYDGYEEGAASKIAMAVDAMYNYNSDRSSIIDTRRGGLSHAAIRSNETFELHMDTLKESRNRCDAEYYYEVTNNNGEWHVNVLSSESSLQVYKLADFINKYADDDLHVCEVPVQYRFSSEETKYIMPIRRLPNLIEKAYEHYGQFDEGNVNKNNAEAILNSLLETQNNIVSQDTVSLNA